MFEPKRPIPPRPPLTGSPGAAHAEPPGVAAARVRSSTSLPQREGGLREFVFTVADFERVRKLIYQHAGISLSAAKQDMVYSRLARRLRATGKDSFGDYLALLEKGDKEEWEKFVNSLTTNLTSFFREPHHFPIFAEHLKRLGSRSPIRVWCSAASTGEEPYSIAMTVAETFGGFNTPVSIIASDLDTNVLATADKGIYAMDRVERISPERLKRFFSRGPAARRGLLRCARSLRRMIQFQPVNLLDVNLAGKRPARRDFLPQRNDLFRQADPVQNTFPLCADDAGRWPALCWPLGELSARGRSFPLTRQDGI